MVLIESAVPEKDFVTPSYDSASSGIASLSLSMIASMASLSSAVREVFEDNSSSFFAKAITLWLSVSIFSTLS